MINNSTIELTASNTPVASACEPDGDKVVRERIEYLELQIEIVKERNAKVEADKAWETSAFRIGTICIITYAIAALVLCLLGAKKYWLDACVPPIGFFLSTQSLPLIKGWWIKTKWKK